MNRRQRTAAAKSPKITLNAATANTPAAPYEAGLAHFYAGRHLDAQMCCQQALSTDAGHADTQHLMGLLSLRVEQYDHAVEWISRAIRQNPKPEYIASLGTALQQHCGRVTAGRAGIGWAFWPADHAEVHRREPGSAGARD
jgi:tetratricopeptide (TPR) repeat protein